jgi:hypothetical protein
MNTRDRQEDLDDQFDTMLRNGLDRLAAHTPTSTPHTFDPDAVPISAIDSPEARRWTPYLVTAAAATILVVGLVTVEGRDDPQTPTASPAATPPPNASEPATSPSTLIDVTTTVVDSPELIPVGAVICIDAGAGQRAADLCAEELGGLAIAGTSTTDSSFVMPVDPAKPADVAGTADAAAAMDLPVADFDAGLLPPSLVPPAHATTYLVLGTSNPYSS